MPEDPQVVSISSSSQLSPDEIARKSFPAARRGVDGEAVRVFLGKAAAELRDALEREAMLRQRVVEAERRAEDPVLDEATLTRAIGIETSKILWTAHDAAKNVVSKAETRAAELIAEAEQILADQIAASDAEALEIRGAAEHEAAEYTSRAQAEANSVTEEAQTEAVELLDATKEECRRMVAEARELRNRTLADLVARRRALRTQLEELRVGRDSLIRVVDVVAASVDELRERLASAEDEARVDAEEAGHRVALEPEQDDLGDLEAEIVAAGEGAGEAGLGTDAGVSSDLALADEAGGENGALRVTERPATGTDQAGSTASRRSVDELFARIRASRAAEEAATAEGIYDIEAVTAAEAGAGSETSVEAAIEAEEALEDELLEAGAEAQLAERKAELAAELAESDAELDADLSEAALEVLEAAERLDERSLEDGDAESARAAGEAEAEAEKGVATTDSAAGAEMVAAGEAEIEAAGEAEAEADAIAEPDVEALARRDHLLETVTAKLGRALKRALQDDQNDLLNALRQASGKPVLDALVPPNAQRERFVTATTDQLARAFEAGAAFLVTGDTVEGPSVTAPAPTEMAAFEAGALIAAELADDLSSMLRQRIEEALSELDGSLEGSADAAGVAYREWKGARVEGLAGDFTTRAFAVGELAVLSSLGGDEAPLVRWVVEDDDAGGSCPDCDDNSLAGPQPPGVEFPTGHAHPPVHPGCRCLLVPVRS